MPVTTGKSTLFAFALHDETETDTDTLENTHTSENPAGFSALSADFLQNY